MPTAALRRPRPAATAAPGAAPGAAQRDRGLPRGTGQAAAPQTEESLESLLAQMEKKFQFWEVFGGWEEVDL